jgi:hypothetical protein
LISGLTRLPVNYLYLSAMRSQLLILLLIIGFQCPILKLIGQSPVNQVGAKALAVSGASMTFKDVWSQFHNQAGLASIKGFAVGIGFQNQFLIKELSTKSIALALPTKSGVFGLNCYSFGYSSYSENKFGLAYSRNLGKKLAVGIQLNYHFTNIRGEYGNRGIATGEIGILAEPLKNLLIGAHINNVWHTKRTQFSDEYLPVIFKIGAAYQFYEKVLLSIEFDKDIDKQAVFKTGIEFEFIPNFFFSSGISSGTKLFSFGPGYEFGFFRADLAFTKHPVLGYSQAISIVYSFKNRL